MALLHRDTWLCCSIHSATSAFNGLSQHPLGSLPQHLRQQVSFGDWNRYRLRSSFHRGVLLEEKGV